jgi:uncharacterized membrane protein
MTPYEPGTLPTTFGVLAWRNVYNSYGNRLPGKVLLFCGFLWPLLMNFQQQPTFTRGDVA